MQRKNIAMTVASALALTGTATAGGGTFAPLTDLLGGASNTLAGAGSSSSGDWCQALKGGLPKYKGDNAFIQEAKLFGRLQYQWGKSEGTYNNADFDSNGDEMRRLRVGTQIKFLNGFKLKGNVNLETGGYRNHDFDFHSFDELYLAYTMKDVAGLDSLTAGYGRRKVAVSQEANTSSKEIKTVERSNVGNYFYADRVTGFTLDAEKGDVEFGLGVFSSDYDAETIAGWDDGMIYTAHASFNDLHIHALYNDFDTVDPVGFEWGVSVGYDTSIGTWDLMLNALYGHDNNGEAVYGVVIMPSKYLIEDKLEAVVRYQYFGSEGQSVKLNSRNVRNGVKEDIGASVGTGDENHSIYAGLNYYMCGHNAKIMTGVEYETLEGTGVDLDATTLWAAFRMYF